MKLDRRQTLPLYRAARSLSPDLWLAVRFLGRSDRDALLAVAALLRLLDDLVAGRETQDAATARQGAEDHPGPAHASDSPPASTCACGSGSIEARAAIAHNIVEYLFEEARPGSIGRAELEAFVIVRDARRLPRDPFDRFIDGLVELAQAKRVATRAVLHRLIDSLAAPLAEIAIAVFTDAPRDEAAPGAASAARFIIRTRQLIALRQAWRSDDRCLIALEDLACFGLRDREYGAWLLGAEPRSSPTIAEQCERLMESQRRAAMAHLADGLKLIDALDRPQARALAAYIGFWGEALLDARLGGASKEQENPATRRSVRFRAWRYAISGRVSPRLLANLHAVDSGSAEPDAVQVATISPRCGRVTGETA